jgi:hypothetical protein
MMKNKGTCDLCNAGIEYSAGYIFYSAAIAPGSTGETGLMHICQDCTDKWINDHSFNNPLEIRSQIKNEDFIKNPKHAFEWLQRGNANGIIAVCKSLELSPEKAREKARALGQLFWTNRNQAITDAQIYWTSFHGKSPKKPVTAPGFKTPPKRTSFQKDQRKKVHTDHLPPAGIVMGIPMIGLGILAARWFGSWFESDLAGFLGFLLGAALGMVIGSFLMVIFSSHEDTRSRPSQAAPGKINKSKDGLQSYTTGLRPFGNKRRLAKTKSEDDTVLLFFRSSGNAIRYFETFLKYARINPPPFLIEISVLFMPVSIYAEKFAVVLPNYNTDMRPGYKQWAIDTIRNCNKTIIYRNSQEHSYNELHKYAEVIISWDLLVPGDFSMSSQKYQNLLRDESNECFPPIKIAGREGVASPPQFPVPKGSWIGILFEISTFDEAVYGNAATKILINIINKQNIKNCIIHAGDILPECKYWCMAIHTDSDQQLNHIRKAVSESDQHHLAPADKRLVQQTEIPLDNLLYLAFVSDEGRYVGIWSESIER